MSEATVFAVYASAFLEPSYSYICVRVFSDRMRWCYYRVYDNTKERMKYIWLAFWSYDCMKYYMCKLFLLSILK